jgi:signal transduction histidine kinase
VLKCPVSVTFLFVEDGAAFVPVASFGLTPAEQEALGALRGPPATLSGLLAQLQRDDAVETAELPLGGGSEGDEARGAGRQLCIALRRGTDIIGLQAVAHRDGSPHFSVSVRRVARGIAQLASMALEHQRLVTELERANRLKSDFVATMSHELRTPLNVIIGYNELLRDHEFGHLTGEQMEVLQHVATSARELLDLVNAVLDLNRLETGRLPLNLQTTSVPDLLEEIRQETSALGRKRDLALNWNVAPDLPRLNTDALKLKVVLKNLVVNACKFTERGTVTVDAAPRDDGVEIAVTDTGMGIAPEALPLIFEPFRQLESTSTRRHGGVGLGLHIVHRLLDLLGGTVSVTSQLGQGSSFRVWVPQRADGEARVPHFAPSGRTTPTLPNSGGPRFPARSAPC